MQRVYPHRWSPSNQSTIMAIISASQHIPHPRHIFTYLPVLSNNRVAQSKSVKTRRKCIPVIHLTNHATRHGTSHPANPKGQPVCTPRIFGTLGASHLSEQKVCQFWDPQTHGRQQSVTYNHFQVADLLYPHLRTPLANQLPTTGTTSGPLQLRRLWSTPHVDPLTEQPYINAFSPVGRNFLTPLFPGLHSNYSHQNNVAWFILASPRLLDKL